MKDFFHKYSYSIVKMFVNQFAISAFGSVLAMAATASGSDGLTLAVSIGAIIFYLFLLYVMTWEIGAKDRVSVDIGKKKYRPFTGVVLSLLANIPNFIIGILFALGAFLEIDILRFISRIAYIVLEGMYLGITTVLPFGWEQSGALALQDSSVAIYFIITLPAIITCGLAYFLGHHNVKFTTLFDYKDPNQKKKK